MTTKEARRKELARRMIAQYKADPVRVTTKMVKGYDAYIARLDEREDREDSHNVHSH